MALTACRAASNSWACNLATAHRASTTRCVVAAPRRTSPSATAATGAWGSATLRSFRRRLAVVLGEISRDGVDVFLRDRRAECVDHLVHRRRPAGLVEEARVHLDVIEAVAGEALRRLVAARRILQHDLFLLRRRRPGGEREHQCERAHQTIST